MIGKETKNAQEQVQARSNIRQRIVIGSAHKRSLGSSRGSI